jgi:cholesterol transport system auxiliary component
MKRLLVLLPLLVAGCGGLLKSISPPETVFSPTVGAASPLTPSLDAVLVVARPDAAPGLDGDAIVLGLPDHRRDRIAAARWAAPLPELIRAHLVMALGARGGWRTVVSDRSAFNGAYLLQTEIRQFSADYDGGGSAPVVHVLLHAELGRLRDRSLLASIDAAGEARATGDRQSAIVAAFDAALAAATDTLGTRVHAATAAAVTAR